MVSTFSQLSAEIEGRTYGSGVLKHELREAGRIQLILPQTASDHDIGQALREIDRLLRDGKNMPAQIAADRFIAKRFPLLLTKERLVEMREDLRYLRARRQKRNENKRAN